MLQDLKLALLSISQPHDSTLQLDLHADGLHNDPLWSMVDEFIATNEQLSIRDRFQSKGRGEQLKYVIDCECPDYRDSSQVYLISTHFSGRKI